MDPAFTPWALGFLSVVCGELFRRVIGARDELNNFKREVEKEFQRKDGLKADIKEAVSAAFSPLNEKIEGILDEQERSARNMSILLDKFHVPAVDRA